MEIRAVSWEQTIPLRQSVLWPNKPPEYCHVEGDIEASHFGVFVDELLVCVASIYLASNRARLRKFATDNQYQNHGIGSKMLAHIIQTLRSSQVEVFWCDAREKAIPFYERFGMQVCSERFYKADVAYYKMEFVL